MLGLTSLLLLPILAAAVPPPPIDRNPPIPEACQRLADEAHRGYGYPLQKIEFFQKCKATVKPKTKDGAPLYRCTHDPKNCNTGAAPLKGESAVLCRSIHSNPKAKQEEPLAWKLLNGLYVYDEDVERAFLPDVLNSAPLCMVGLQTCYISPLSKEYCAPLSGYIPKDAINDILDGARADNRRDPIEDILDGNPKKAGDDNCLDLPEADRQIIRMWNPTPPALLTHLKTVKTSMVAVFKGKGCQGNPISIFSDEKGYEHKSTVNGESISVRAW